MEQTNTEKRLPWYGIPAILPYLKEYRTKMVIMVFFGAVSSVADAVFPLFNRYALNHFADGKTLDTMGLFVLLYVAVLLVQVAANLISAFLISFVELDVGRDLKNAAFNHLQTLSFSYYNNHSASERWSPGGSWTWYGTFPTSSACFSSCSGLTPSFRRCFFCFCP